MSQFPIWQLFIPDLWLTCNVVGTYYFNTYDHDNHKHGVHFSCHLGDKRVHELFDAVFGVLFAKLLYIEITHPRSALQVGPTKKMMVNGFHFQKQGCILFFKDGKVEQATWKIVSGLWR